jgi:hypothetical protein
VLVEIKALWDMTVCQLTNGYLHSGELVASVGCELFEQSSCYRKMGILCLTRPLGRQVSGDGGETG